MRVMEFPGDGDGAIEMIDCLWIIAGLPVHQADVADGLAFFESVAQLLFHFQRTPEKIKREGSITQVLVTVADEPECDRFTMAVLECSIRRERLFVLRQRLRWSSRGIDTFGVRKQFVGGCTILRRR